MGLNDTLEQLEAARAECARLEAALEAAEQERDELRASLTELQPTSAVWRANRAAEDAKREADRLTAERDSLAAVIERVREWERNPFTESGWRREALVEILATAPTVSLAEHDAQVLEAAQAEADNVRRVLWIIADRLGGIEVSDAELAAVHHLPGVSIERDVSRGVLVIRAEAARLREEAQS